MSETPSRAIEIHDSYLGRIEKTGTSIELHFEPAYVHQSSGEPGVASGTGWIQNALFTLSDASLEGDPFKLPADLYGGTLVVDGTEIRTLLALPSEYVGEIVLTLSDRQSGTTVLFRCSRLTIAATGEAEYVEDVE